jgi:hypothetical protein
MAINFSEVAYLPNYNTFARPVTFYPFVSRASQPAFQGRGIYDTRAIDVVAQDGSILSDQETILDILEAEFSILPLAGDRVDIPAASGIPAEGMFEIIDTDSNGGGETTLTLRKWLPSDPE